MFTFFYINHGWKNNLLSQKLIMQANNTIPANAMNQMLYPEACRSWDPFKKKFNNQFKDEI